MGRIRLSKSICSPSFTCLHDISNDGKVIVVSSNEYYPDTETRGNVKLLVNNSEGDNWNQIAEIFNNANNSSVITSISGDGSVIAIFWGNNNILTYKYINNTLIKFNQELPVYSNGLQDIRLNYDGSILAFNSDDLYEIDTYKLNGQSWSKIDDIGYDPRIDSDYSKNYVLQDLSDDGNKMLVDQGKPFMIVYYLRKSLLFI